MKLTADCFGTTKYSLGYGLVLHIKEPDGLGYYWAALESTLWALAAGPTIGAYGATPGEAVETIRLSVEGLFPGSLADLIRLPPEASQ